MERVIRNAAWVRSHRTLPFLSIIGLELLHRFEAMVIMFTYCPGKWQIGLGLSATLRRARLGAILDSRSKPLRSVIPREED